MRTQALTHTCTHTHAHQQTYFIFLNTEYTNSIFFFFNPAPFLNSQKSSPQVFLAGHSGHSKLQGDHGWLIFGTERSWQLSVTVFCGTAALYSPFSSSTGRRILPSLLSKHLLVFFLLYFLPTEKRSSQDKGLRSGRETALYWGCFGLQWRRAHP